MSEKHPYWPDLTDDEGDALAEWFSDICGACVDGQCHWGGKASQWAMEAVTRGEEYRHPDVEPCRCARHVISVAARRYVTGDPVETALAWRAAKESGDVELVGDGW